MQFPHLNDTQFPNLNNVNVYTFQNNFDYSRWNEKTNIKLCNVLWNSDYTDVVKWDTNSARDSYFDNIEGYTVELQTAARVVPSGFIKLPIPYDVLAKYNYIVVDMPIATSDSNKLDYETNDGLRRWYFFIDKIEYNSPSTTTTYVSVDVWTNFQNEIDIRYMVLERGHAPVFASNTNDYLANPIANNKYLLAPDVNFDNTVINRSTDYVPFGNGDKYVCIASTCAPEQFQTLGNVYSDSTYNPTGIITYSDIDVRYGHQLQVNGLSIGNGRNYSTARTAAKAGQSSDDILANNLAVYAIRATECYGNGTFFTDIINTCPQFLNTVQACFVVDSECLSLGNTHILAGHTLYECKGAKNNLLTKQLTIADFNYPLKYQRFAKLYTAPYAVLEITDNNGTTFEINIEETSTVQVKSIVSVAFPYINERVYIDGIGGIGSQSYSWKDLNGNVESLNMPNSDWFKYCFDWKIPTFALYMDGETAFQLSNFNRNVKQGINNALVAYHNSMRSANTAMENAHDSATTGKSNADAAAYTANVNANNSADNSKTNAYNTADTNKANLKRDADTLNANSVAIANNIKAANTRIRNNNVKNLQQTNTGTAYNEEQNIVCNDALKDYSNTKAAADTLYANQMMFYTTVADIEKSTSTAWTSAASAIGGGAIAGASMAAPAGAALGAAVGSAVPVLGNILGAGGGAIGGAVIGAASGGMQAWQNVHTNTITTNTARDIADKQIETNSNTLAEHTDLADKSQTIMDSTRRAIYAENALIATNQLSNTNETARVNSVKQHETTTGNAGRSKTCMYTNADTTYNSDTTNADNSYNTSTTNAANNYATSIANNLRTYNTTTNNATYTRDVSELNAKELLENACDNAMAAINDSKNQLPRIIGANAGDYAQDALQTRGIQIKVKTQSDYAISATGDIFTRYGYMLNQIWPVQETGLNLMNYFTYWKASEIWIDDAGSTNNNINTFIRNIFLNGVTVWNNPTEIGRINVYNN